MVRIWQKLRLKNVNNLITIIGCILIIGIMFSGVNSMMVMIVLGLLNFYMGAYSYIEKKTPFRTDYSKVIDQSSYCQKLGVCLMALGIYIIGMAAIYFIQIVSSEIYWNIFGIGLLIIIVMGFYFHKKGIRK